MCARLIDPRPIKPMPIRLSLRRVIYLPYAFIGSARLARISRGSTEMRSGPVGPDDVRLFIADLLAGFGHGIQFDVDHHARLDLPCGSSSSHCSSVSRPMLWPTWVKRASVADAVLGVEVQSQAGRSRRAGPGPAPRRPVSTISTIAA